MAKRLVFSTATPNDQGGIVPNDSIVWDRYEKNPVLLSDHAWWTGAVLGKMTDIRFENGKWSGVPVFHKATQLSVEAAGMYEQDALNAASIGGEAVWKTNAVTGDYFRDDKGFKVCEKFYLYEISLLPLPSNMDAVGEQTGLCSVKFYEAADPDETTKSLARLSSQFNYEKMFIPKSPIMRNADAGETGAAGGGEAGKTNNAKPAPAGTAEPTALGATTDVNQLPAVIQQIIKNGGSVTFASGAPVRAGAVPTPTDTPKTDLGDDTIGDPQPEPIGLKAQEALKKFRAYHKAHEKASTALATLAKAKKEMDEADDEDSEEMGASFKAAQLAAEKACEEAEKKEEEYKAAQEEADDEEKTKKEKNAAGGKRTSFAAAGMTTTSAATKPELEPLDNMKDKLKLAAAPSFKAQVGASSQGVTFTKLNSPKASEDDQRLMKRVFHADRNTQVDIRDHAVVLNAMLNDPRLRPVIQKVRLMSDVTEGQMRTMMSNPTANRGTGLQQLAADFNAGRIQYRNQGGQLENLTMLTSTDNALASPALNTIEWLSLAIFELFPTTSWKANIPMFGAQMTSRNTGIILANIVADPTIYKGTSPAPAADYTYGDQAVALALTPYWLQPMLWKPLDMHQLRYDQMSTGWAQAFAKWNSVIDDNLIYTLASTVPASAILPTSGLSRYDQVAQTFNIPASGPQNSFYWNPAFAGTLNNPVLNDIIGLEQIYRNQNFELEREKGVLVIDSIMERYLATDPQTQSLLTRWIDSNGEEFKGFKHTTLNVRSRVAVYDLATKQVKDINGAIPATAVSAALGFIPSQCGIGIGLLDVFMIQDPTNYGYRMSADIRIGAVPLRFNFFGTSLYAYALAGGNPA